ncbi:hypothetical protein [Arthrobacter sp.]|uniref:hypothetical protein n=1 Tax=Arthrobacter sp. TaxID=1667 RepID=UPI003A94A051
MSENTTENRLAELGDAAHQDLNKVLGTALGVAREQLEANGVFLPFAIGLEPDAEEEGELRLLAVQPPEEEQDPEADIDAEAMMEDLVTLLTGQRDQFTAVALVSDVTLMQEHRDAIHAMAEHSLGGAVAVIQPYTAPANDGGEWTFEEPTPEPGELQIWA